MVKLFRTKLMTIVVVAALNISGTSLALSDDSGLAGTLHALKRERGRLCMDGHFHYGSSGVQRTKSRATRAAIRDWRGFVDWEYGSDWARWSRAASRSRNCSRVSGGWKCSVEARPCR